MPRRSFGSIRKRSSGDWQAYYQGRDGRRRSAGMYRTKSDANAALGEAQTLARNALETMPASVSHGASTIQVREPWISTGASSEATLSRHSDN
jgi:hypothetical protein